MTRGDKPDFKIALYGRHLMKVHSFFLVMLPISKLTDVFAKNICVFWVAFLLYPFLNTALHDHWLILTIGGCYIIKNESPIDSLTSISIVEFIDVFLSVSAFISFTVALAIIQGTALPRFSVIWREC